MASSHLLRGHLDAAFSLCIRSNSLPVSRGLTVSATKPVMALPVHSPDTRQASEGGFWRLDHAFDNFVRLKNVLLKSSVTVMPVLYMEDGFEVDLKPVTLGPASVISIYLQKALRAAGREAARHALVNLLTSTRPCLSP